MNDHQETRTLWDWYAGQTLVGYLASYSPGAHIDLSAAALFSANMADRMLEERSKRYEHLD